MIAKVGATEPLAVTGHGNDNEIGDEGNDPADWLWSVNDFANLLAGLPSHYNAPILLEVCSDTLANFAAHVAVRLGAIGKLTGTWLYGYNKAVDVTHPFPDPAKLNKNAELQATQVR